jgi:hypothetical protein
MFARRSHAKTRKHSLCFVDDDEHELRRFKAAFKDDFYVGIGTDLGMAEANLSAILPRHRFKVRFWRRKVDLYVLDMYFPTGTTNTSEQRARLAKAWANCCKANHQLRTILAELHQTFAGGRELATQVRRRGFLRKPPFVFFTRKGNLEDGIEAYEQVKPIAVIKKPDPWDETDASEEAKDNALLESRQTIRKKFQTAIDNASFFYQHKETILALIIGFVTGVLANSAFLLFHR